MQRKYMPLILMLSAGAVTAIITLIKRYALVTRLGILLAVLLIFYVLGSLLKWLLDTFEAQNKKRAMDEGAVIEKETEAAEDAGEGEQEKEPAQEEE